VHAATIYRWEEGITKPSVEHASLWGAVLAELIKELNW
jgi:hypothetical protein